MFDGERRPVTALLRPARRPTGREVRGFLRRHVGALECRTSARLGAGPDKLRRYKEFRDAAASWSRVEPIIARVEASAQGTDRATGKP